MTNLSQSTLLIFLLSAAGPAMAAAPPDHTPTEDRPVHQGLAHFQGQIVDSACYVRVWGQNSAHTVVLPKNLYDGPAGWSPWKPFAIAIAGCSEQTATDAVVNLEPGWPADPDGLYVADPQGTAAVRLADEYGTRLVPGTPLHATALQEDVVQHFRLKASYRLTENDTAGDRALVPVNVNVRY
ncbi:fimbrial protein, partial [Lelliottia sp. WAP21]|uniref:fimbrial protein n=1 Tax=Lelliottia sp. WAP21 TaxID=2877426 RepID=UPI001F20873A